MQGGAVERPLAAGVVVRNVAFWSAHERLVTVRLQATQRRNAVAPVVLAEYDGSEASRSADRERHPKRPDDRRRDAERGVDDAVATELRCQGVGVIFDAQVRLDVHEHDARVRAAPVRVEVGDADKKPRATRRVVEGERRAHAGGSKRRCAEGTGAKALRVVQRLEVDTAVAAHAHVRRRRRRRRTQPAMCHCRSRVVGGHPVRRVVESVGVHAGTARYRLRLFLCHVKRPVPVDAERAARGEFPTVVLLAELASGAAVRVSGRVCARVHAADQNRPGDAHVRLLEADAVRRKHLRPVGDSRAHAGRHGDGHRTLRIDVAGEHVVEERGLSIRDDFRRVVVPERLLLVLVVAHHRRGCRSVARGPLVDSDDRLHGPGTHAAQVRVGLKVFHQSASHDDRRGVVRHCDSVQQDVPVETLLIDLHFLPRRVVVTSLDEELAVTHIRRMSAEVVGRKGLRVSRRWPGHGRRRRRRRRRRRERQGRRGRRGQQQLRRRRRRVVRFAGGGPVGGARTEEVCYARGLRDLIFVRRVRSSDHANLARCVEGRRGFLIGVAVLGVDDEGV